MFISSRVWVKVLLILILLFLAVNFSQIQVFLQTKFNQYFTSSICDKPTTYKIGFIDPQFHLSSEDFLADAEDAAKIWNKTTQRKQLFLYNNSDEKALTINLIFDQRTSLNNQINNLKNQVKQTDQYLQSNINSYQQEAADFKKRLAFFNTRVNNLSQQIIFWNQKGGGSVIEYQKLIQEQNDLKSEQISLQNEAQHLNQTARSLNLYTQDYNTNVDELNNTISLFDEALAQKPEGGQFDANKNTIAIYFDNNHNELIHTLAHELGHALGLDHNQNHQSIMYAYTSKTIILSAEDISSLNLVCSKRYLNLPFLKGYWEFPVALQN